MEFKKIFLVAFATLLMGSTLNISASDQYPNEDFVEVEETGIDETIHMDDNSYIIIDIAYCTDDLKVEGKNTVDNRAGGIDYLQYFKTVTLSNSSPSFPKTYFYREYVHSRNAWYSGTFTFVKCEKKGNSYVATYTGALLIEL